MNESFASRLPPVPLRAVMLLLYEETSLVTPLDTLLTVLDLMAVYWRCVNGRPHFLNGVTTINMKGFGGMSLTNLMNVDEDGTTARRLRTSRGRDQLVFIEPTFHGRDLGHLPICRIDAGAWTQNFQESVIVVSGKSKDATGIRLVRGIGPVLEVMLSPTGVGLVGHTEIPFAFPVDADDELCLGMYVYENLDNADIHLIH